MNICIMIVNYMMISFFSIHISNIKSITEKNHINNDFEINEIGKFFHKTIQLYMIQIILISLFFGMYLVIIFFESCVRCCPNNNDTDQEAYNIEINQIQEKQPLVKK